MINWFNSPPTLIISGFSTYYPILIDKFNYGLNTINIITIQFTVQLSYEFVGSLNFGLKIFNDSSLLNINEEIISISSLSVQSANIINVKMQ